MNLLGPLAARDLAKTKNAVAVASRQGFGFLQSGPALLGLCKGIRVSHRFSKALYIIYTAQQLMPRSVSKARVSKASASGSSARSKDWKQRIQRSAKAYLVVVSGWRCSKISKSIMVSHALVLTFSVPDLNLMRDKCRNLWNVYLADCMCLHLCFYSCSLQDHAFRVISLPHLLWHFQVESQ